MKCVSAKFLLVGLGTGILAGVLSGLLGIGGGVESSAATFGSPCTSI
jgi:hypothetical protein